MELEIIKHANYLQVDKDVPDKGTWKVTDKIFIKDEHGQVLVVRMVIDKDLGKAGDEKIVEWQQEAAREISILNVFSSFPLADAESWPPPRKMFINQNGDEINFVSLNTQAGHHDPFTGFVNGRLVSHWEYQNGAGDKFLQVYQDEGMVYMATGYALNEAFVRIV
jgi:hypothetical protein